MTTYVFIVLVEFYPKWLSLSRAERNAKAGILKEITAKYPLVNVRFFDAEALPGAHYTDIVFCETTDIKQYHYMWEEIRDNDVYINEYMKIKDVIMGMEDMYVKYEQEILNIE